MEKTCLKLKEIGVDTDGIITRLGGNELLYLTICRKFLQDPNFGLFKSALISEDSKAARTYIHTLKGVAANLGFIQLSLVCDSMLEEINRNHIMSLEQKYQELCEVYYKIISILKESFKPY